jgi:hypothetical protein
VHRWRRGCGERHAYHHFFQERVLKNCTLRACFTQKRTRAGVPARAATHAVLRAPRPAVARGCEACAVLMPAHPGVLSAVRHNRRSLRHLVCSISSSLPDSEPDMV